MRKRTWRRILSRQNGLPTRLREFAWERNLALDSPAMSTPQPGLTRTTSGAVPVHVTRIFAAGNSAGPLGCPAPRQQLLTGTARISAIWPAREFVRRAVIAHVLCNRGNRHDQGRQWCPLQAPGHASGVAARWPRSVKHRHLRALRGAAQPEIVLDVAKLSPQEAAAEVINYLTEKKLLPEV